MSSTQGVSILHQMLHKIITLCKECDVNPLPHKINAG